MKRVLLDENVDRRLKRFFSSDLEVSTVSEEGWSGLTNGKLLKEASLHFEVLVTMDSNLLHQQHPHTININPKPQQYFVLKNLDFCLDIGVHFTSTVGNSSRSLDIGLKALDNMHAISRSGLARILTRKKSLKCSKLLTEQSASER